MRREREIHSAVLVGRLNQDSGAAPSEANTRSDSRPPTYLTHSPSERGHQGNNGSSSLINSPSHRDSSQLEPQFCSVAIPRWKRVLDVALIALSLPVILPFMFCMALLIRLVSAGPVLFQQERVGYLGRRFMCLKFRTMVVGANTSNHQGHLDDLINSNTPMVKLDAHGDARIIPLGRVLRASGLDEIPQLFNVLRGDMSLVGPRPCLPYEYEKYQMWQRERFNTLPGLTGLWQVNGKNKTTFMEMMHWDIEYVRRKTLWLDLAIMLRTPVAILGQVLETQCKARQISHRPKAAISVQPRN